MNFRRLLCRLRTLGWLTVVLVGLLPGVAGAQPVAAPAAGVIQPATRLEIPPPKLRTWKEMEAAAALEAAGPPPPPRVIPFRPTIDAATYRQLKAKAAQAPRAPAAPGITGLAPLAATVLSNPKSFEGVDSVTAGNFRPPDTHGAAGPNHFVEITNSHLDIYEKAAPNNHVIGLPLSSFFGYTTKGLFDVRVIYDSVSQRWIVSASAFPDTTAVTMFFFAVSQGDDPTGNFFIYNVNVSLNNGMFTLWDFPQLGLDRNAVIFTANVFQGATASNFDTYTFVDARMFTVAKSLLNSGPTIGPGQTIIPTKLFIGLTANLAPPIVLDDNSNTYLVAADSAFGAHTTVTLYTLTNSGAILPDLPDLSGPVPIPVPAYSWPANAPQYAPPPGSTSALLDTSDARFVNAGTQIGDSLFQVHSIDSGGFARCRFYEFDTAHNAVIQSGDFRRSDNSFDFNASIAANQKKDVFVTWSATDPTNNVNAEVRFSGRRHTDPLNVIPSPGSLLPGGTSATFYSYPGDPLGSERWGDYSAVSLDPADPTGSTAWIVNEKILTNSTWGSRIGRIRLPVNLSAIDLLLLGD